MSRSSGRAAAAWLLFGALKCSAGAGPSSASAQALQLPVFDPDATYRILTRYGRTEVDLADYLADGVSGIAFTLSSCESTRSDSYDSITAEDGKLKLTSNTLGHIHGSMTGTEAECAVVGAGADRSASRVFSFYTVSGRTPRLLRADAITVTANRTDSLDIRVAVGGTSYVRVGWRKAGGRFTFGVAQGVTG